MFAMEHLSLKPATLEAAIDIRVFEAQQLVDGYLSRLRRSAIAPLLDAHPDELTGKNVVEKLAGPGDVVLLGRSGLGKSFHLEHFRRSLDENEIPILLNANYYKGDLNRAIHKTIGQYTPLTPAALLGEVKRLGLRPVLIVDGWSNTLATGSGDLGEIHSFQDPIQRTTCYSLTRCSLLSSIRDGNSNPTREIATGT